VIPSGVRIFLCLEPVDMRLGFDRLARIARERLGRDPVDGGALFVFGARGSTRLKVLWFDRNGLCVLYKRFHQAKFELPKATGTPQYRAGVEFTDGDAAAIDSVITRNRAGDR